MLSRMASDDAADLLLEIKQDRRRPVLELLPAAKQRKIKGLLGYNPSTAGGVMSPDFVTVRPDATVAQALAAARAPRGRARRRCTRSSGRRRRHARRARHRRAAARAREPEQPLAALAEDSPPPVTAEVEIPEVARVMTDYNLVTLPVVDARRAADRRRLRRRHPRAHAARRLAPPLRARTRVESALGAAPARPLTGHSHDGRSEQIRRQRTPAKYVSRGDRTRRPLVARSLTSA